MPSNITPVLDLSSLQALQNELGSFGFNLTELWQFVTPISATLHENSWSNYDIQHESTPFGGADHSVNYGGAIRMLDIETTLGHLDLSSMTFYQGAYDHYDYVGGLQSWNGHNDTYTVNTLQFTANPMPVAPDPYILFGVERGTDLGDKFDFGCLPALQPPAPPSNLTSLIVVDVDQDNFQYGGWSAGSPLGPEGPGNQIGGSWTDDVREHQHTAIGATLTSLFDDVARDITHTTTSEFHFGAISESSLHVDTNMVRDAHWTALGLLG